MIHLPTEVRHKIFSCLLMLLTLGILCNSSLAQTNSGSLSGTVLDDQGQPTEDLIVHVWDDFDLNSVSTGNNPPAIDFEGFGAVHSSRPGYDATLCWIGVIDHDGIAYDGSSHQVTVTFNGETHPLYHVRSDSAFTAKYEYWDSNIPAPAGEYVFTVTDPDGNTTILGETLEVNPLPVADHNTFNIIPNGTSPTITWDPVPAAVRYRIRIYDMNWNIIWHGYPRTQPSLAYTVPPGILQPNTSYHYRIRSWNRHYPYNFDNDSVSDYRTFTTGEESVIPLIETDVGAATRNSDDLGNYLYFWTKVHDAQGVPENIRSVTATFPDGTTIPLHLDYNESDTCGIYYAEDFVLPISVGDYTITVEDRDENTHSITETLDVNPIGYPADATVSAAVKGTQVDVTWEAVADAVFYRVEIRDMEGNRLHTLGSRQNAYVIPAGYLKENTSYQYRITTCREFFDQGVDNSSRSVMKTFETGLNQATSTQEIILTIEDTDITISRGDNATVYGTSTSNHITLESGAIAELINFPGQNSIHIQSSSDLFSVSRSGTIVTFQGTDGTVLKIPATNSIQTVTFADRAPLTLSIYNHQVMLDDQVINTTSAVIENSENDQGLYQFSAMTQNYNNTDYFIAFAITGDSISSINVLDGPNIVSTWDNHAYLSQRPKPGDTYAIRINYSDGTNQESSYTVEGVNDHPALIVSPQNFEIIETTQPIIEWQQITGISSGYVVIIHKIEGDKETAIWMSSDIDPVDTSCVFNFDNSASESLQPGGTYRLHLHSYNENGNSATKTSVFTISDN